MYEVTMMIIIILIIFVVDIIKVGGDEMGTGY